MALEVNIGSGTRPRPGVLVILDGFGVAPESPGNAISVAKTPTFDLLTERYPVVTLRASGEEVGVEWGEMGNSEVGHLTIGSGRVHRQTLPRINATITSKEFFDNPALLKAVAHVRETNGTLHILGLCSSGKVHSSDAHAVALLEFAKQQRIKKVAVHAILDGRDTLYNSGFEFIKHLEHEMRRIGVGEIASMSGRYFAMDRDNRWDRVEKAYNAIALGVSPHIAEQAEEAILASYAKEVYDEEFPPTVIVRGKKPVAPVRAGDAVIFFNYRPDRARQLTKAFVLPTWTHFERTYINNLCFVTMAEYEKNLPVEVAFTPQVLAHTLAQELSAANFTQLHIAETEKYAHVTFFLNGAREEPFPHEDRVLIPSPKVATYDLAPEMSAHKITERVLKEIDLANYDAIIVNFANPDMVAHSGNLEATTRSIEVVDACVGNIMKKVLEAGGVMLITADHGNAEEVRNLQTQDIDKEHSTNPVPMWIVGASFEGKAGVSGDVPHHDLALLPPCGLLADVAPTFLAMLGVDKPDEMTGKSLLP